VLRLEPADIVRVAGPVVLFGALMEAVRALAGQKTWWLDAGMAVVFGATGVVLLAGSDSAFATPAALVGWFLMVRGAADVAVAMMSRETDRIWGLLLVVGVLEASLGFFAASPFARTADVMVSVLGALGLLRGVADLVAALRLREAPRMSLLELPAERADGVAGYSAGLTDFESAPAQAGPRHRAAPRLTSAQAMEALATAGAEPSAADEPTTWPAADEPTTWPAAGEFGKTGGAGLSGGTTAAGGAKGSGRADLGTGWAAVGDSAGSGPAETPAGSTGGTSEKAGPAKANAAGNAGGTGNAAAAGNAPTGNAGAGGNAGAAGNMDQAAAGQPGTFHDEVLRTTADLDVMLALAGVTGAAVGAHLPEVDDLPEVPDTPEGVELPKTHPGQAITQPSESSKQA
jgi:uncharacterized membrane protein HdeD (DUF308 family)